MTGSQRSTERLFTGYDGRLFLVLSTGWIAVAISRQLLPPLLPEIIDDLHITPFLAGTVLTVLWAAYALNHYPGGRLADRLSRKTVLVGGLVGIVVGLLLMSISTTYAILVGAVAVFGTGGGLYSVSTRAKTADLFVEKRAQAFGIQMAFTRAGAAAAAGVAVAALAIGTWRSGFLPIALFAAIVAFLLHRWVREPYSVGRIELGMLETTRRVFGRRSIRSVLLAYILLIFTMQGVIGFLPTFLQVEKGFSPALASAGFAAVYVTGIIVGPIAGLIGDSYRKIPIAAGAVIVAAIGLSGLITVNSTVGITISIVAFAIGLWSFPPVVQATLMDIFDEGSMAGDFGAAKTVWAILGSLGPSYVGYVAGMWSYTLAYIGMVGSLLACLCVLVWIWARGITHS